MSQTLLEKENKDKSDATKAFQRAAKLTQLPLMVFSCVCVCVCLPSPKGGRFLMNNLRGSLNEANLCSSESPLISSSLSPLI